MEKYTHRYIARVVLEAQTPLFVGSGETSLITDSLVQKDIHGFPMILGTSLAGVLRHALEDKETNKQKWNSFFGYQAPTGKKGEGSQVKISSAYLILDDNKIAEGLNITDEQKQFVSMFDNLPVRQHVRINDRGTAVDKGLFDNEVVYKGARFIFELELKGSDEDKDNWEQLIKELKSPKFRLGQGTRNGYGKLSVFSIYEEVFDLNKQDEFTKYLNFDNSLNADVPFSPVTDNAETSDYKHYQLQLKPDDFFVFSAGYSDDDNEVDNMPVTEQVINYDKSNSIQKLDEVGQTLIPATSIKGALSHRTAFHYNKKKEYFADKYSDPKFLEYIETNNNAVYELFGAEEGNKNRDGQRGKVIINDVFLTPDKVSNNKIFNHVAIDRFTGGAMDGALFSEKVSYFNDKDDTLELNIYVESNDYSDKITEALEEALKDVCKGLLPLGGMTTKGHGMFTGKLTKNDDKIYDYEDK